MSNNNLLILVCLFDLGLGPEVHSYIPTKRLVQYLFLLGSKKKLRIRWPYSTILSKIDVCDSFISRTNFDFMHYSYSQCPFRISYVQKSRWINLMMYKFANKCNIFAKKVIFWTNMFYYFFMMSHLCWWKTFQLWYLKYHREQKVLKFLSHSSIIYNSVHHKLLTTFIESITA